MSNLAVNQPESSQIPPLLLAEAKDGRVLTKRFLADGTKIDFDAGMWFRFIEAPIDGWDDFVSMLTTLIECPTVCVLRSALPTDFPRGDFVCYRRKHDRDGEPANLLEIATNWVVYDYDDTAVPFDLADPEASIRAWHATLPAELRIACGAFFPSASAHFWPTVRGKLVTWYRKPVSETMARAYAIHYHADPSVAVATQPNFFSAPIFDGCADPMAGRRTPILFGGPPAVPPPRAALKATRERPAPVSRATGAPMRVGDLPTGLAGIVAALGRQEDMIGTRFYVCGKLAGLMRKLGYEREDCEAVLRQWLAAVKPAELAPRLKWAIGGDEGKPPGAWDRTPEKVSGVHGLAEIVGREHANLIYDACLAARRPVRIGAVK